MISKETISNIVSAARVEEVVGDFVHLKRAGANLKGVCPFHDEKTPSFVVSPAKNIYKCFGCGAAGDSIKFLMEHEGINYPEALRFLAEKYRIEIIEDLSDYDQEESKLRQSEKDSVFIVMKYAAQFFQDNLLQSKEGKSVGLSYIKHRGFNDKTIQDFQLGYASDSFNHFTETALEAGYQAEILESAGLVRSKDGNNPYDFFRARLMFPINNLSGKVVAFGGRILSNNTKQAKYINTPETPIYTKGNLLYGIYQAKDAIRKQDACYLVEGYTDVLALYQAGITNVVASSGTALTKEQVKLISRFTRNIILIYDGDQAGINAALRGVDIMLEQDMKVEVILLPNGADPDSFVSENSIDETLEYFQNNKKDFIFFKADVLLKGTQDDPVRKSQAVKDIVDSIALINDQILRAFYTRECSKIVDLSEDILITEVNKAIIKSHQQKARSGSPVTGYQERNPGVTNIEPEKQVGVEGVRKKSVYAQEKGVLRVMLIYGDKQVDDSMTAMDFILSQINGIEFEHPVYNKLLKAIIQALNDNVDFEQIQDENYYEDEEIKKLIIDIKMSPYELSPNWEKFHNIIIKDPEKTWEDDIFSTVNRYILHRIKGRLVEIDKKIKALSPDQFDECIKLMEEKVLLQNPKIDIAKKFGTIIL
ncbi:MAG TPA: DNA primase [Chitinophagales bacterium]|nr:DNA primase [Chitinophagales bacterium]